MKEMNLGKKPINRNAEPTESQSNEDKSPDQSVPETYPTSALSAYLNHLTTSISYPI
jgi:hypothetical protein